MKAFKLCAMLFVILCGFLYISSITATGLTKEEFIQALLQPTETLAQVELSPEATANAKAQRQRNTQRYYEMMQRQANTVELSQDEIQLRALRLEKAKQQEQVYSPDMAIQQTTTDTITLNTSLSGDDEHTKSLKRRAVIALAVFLPILVLMFFAFFIFIFFFSKGSSSGKAQNPSKSHKSSTNNSNTQKTDRDNRDESSTGGSRTRNQISTTM